MGHLKLTKVQILAHKLSVKPLLEEVQSYGSFHTVSSQELPEGTKRHNTDELQLSKEKLNKIEKTLKLLEPFRKKGTLLDELLPVMDELSQDEADSLAGNAKPELVVERILKLEEDRLHHEKEIGNLQGQITNLIPWRKFPFNRAAFSRTRKVRIETGMIPAANIESLKASLTQCGDCWDLEIVPTSLQKAEQVPVLCIFLAAEASNFVPLLNEAGFQEFRLPERFTADREILRNEENISKLRIETKQCTNSIADKARYVKALRLTLDNVSCEIARLEKENEAIATRTTVGREGWIPAEDFPDLKHKFERFGTVYIEKIDKGKDELEPVILQNGGFATPFEAITQLYATPTNKEYDPTPFLAPFFAIYFGICLTDAGYGLVVLLTCMFLVNRLRPTGATKKLLVALGICGFSTIVLGLLTGGFFGITSSSDAAKAAFPALNNLMISIQKSSIGFDPITDTMFFFKLVLVFGAIHVSLGFLIKAWWNIQNDKAADALYDQFSWLFIILGTVLIALTSMGIVPAAIKTAGIAFMILGALLILVFSGRESEGLVGRIGSGLFELYGVSGLFGDVLSYARLMALGLATGVIAGVVNTLAFMVLDVKYGIGYVLFIIIFVFGHVANIAINAMGAFVHTLRLQFVEFFTKFYEGGGQPFSPLTEDRQYTLIRQRKTQP